MRMNTAKLNLQTTLQMVPINQGRMTHNQLVSLTCYTMHAMAMLLLLHSFGQPTM